jgi:hypothetical protein
MEMIALSNQRFHYPSDEDQMLFNRRYFLGKKVAIGYDPLAAHPDYLLVGPYSRMWGIYNEVLAAGHFRLLRDFGAYQLYERVPAGASTRRLLSDRWRNDSHLA